MSMIEALLNSLYNQTITPEQATQALKRYPFDDLDFAKLDTHRELRKGFPEVVFGQNKSFPHLAEITRAYLESGTPFFATRIDEAVFLKLKDLYPQLIYYPEARIVCSTPPDPPRYPGTILIMSGGTSDFAVAKEAAITAQYLGNHVQMIMDVGVAGLHRLLSYLDDILAANVIIVVAGMEGALPTVVSGLTDKPLIGVPTSVGYGTAFNGLTPLLSMLNSCSSGMSVVNIDNGFGAGFMAASINRVNLKSLTK